MSETIDNPKLWKLLSTARMLLMRHGIHRVSVEEICKEANVSKMTFYKHFDNKIDLAKSVIGIMIDEQIEEYDSIMKQTISFPEKVELMIHMKQRHTEMISREFFQDIWKNPEPEIIELINQKMTESMRIIEKDLRKAQKDGDIRRDINLKFILYFLNMMPSIAQDEHLLKLYKSPKQLVLELTNFFFYGILGKDEDRNT